MMQDVSSHERESIQAIFSHLRAASNLSIGLRMAKEAAPGLRSSANHLFLGPFDFVLGLTALLGGLRASLGCAQKLGLKCAPKIVDGLNLPSGEGVVVLRYGGCMSAPPPLIPARYQIPARTLQSFIHEMQTLLTVDAGHPALLRGREFWRISEDGSCIFLDEWEKLRKFDAQESGLAETALETLERELREAVSGAETNDNPLLEE